MACERLLELLELTWERALTADELRERGQLLKGWADAQGFSKTYLANLFSVSEQTIYRWYLGLNPMHPARARKLAEFVRASQTPVAAPPAGISQPDEAPSSISIGVGITLQINVIPRQNGCDVTVHWAGSA